MCAKRNAALVPEEVEVLDGFTPEEVGLLPLVQFSHKEEVFEICLDGLDPDVAAHLPTQVTVNGRARPTAVRDVRHSGGKVPMFLAPALHMAVVALRQPVYFRKREVGGGEEYAPPHMKDPIASGYRSRLRVLVLVRELAEAAGHPVLAMLTLKSSSVGDFNRLYWKLYAAFHTAAQRALAQHYYQLAQAAKGKPEQAERYMAASRTARGLPRSSFYIPFVIGKGQATAEGGTQTPIGHALPEDVTVADAKALLLPTEARRLLQEPTTQAQVEAFVAEREYGDGGNGTGYGEDEEEEEARAGNHGGGNHNGLLRVRVTLSQADDVPLEYAGLLGKSFGEIVENPDGPNFLYWLCSEYEPRCAGDAKVVEAAHQVTGN